MRTLDVKLAYWAKRKYKRLRVSFQRAMSWLNRIYLRNPRLFAHWQLLYSKSDGLDNRSRVMEDHYTRF